MIGFLLNILNASDRVAATQTNFERLEESFAFMLNPSVVAGVATTELGPPVAGDRVVGELWADSLSAVWRCTVAGGPGTWQQQTPAVVATAGRPATPPDGYWILDTDEHFKAYYWDDGGGVWTAV